MVNGPSNDGTTEFLAAQDGIRVFTNPETNLSISRNIAIANAVGDYICFIDDDAIPEADWLELVVTALDEDPGLSAVGGFIRDSDGIKYQARYVQCDALGRGYYGDTPEYVALLGKGVRTFPSLTGTNVTFRMSDLRKVGGFDETYAISTTRPTSTSAWTMPGCAPWCCPRPRSTTIRAQPPAQRNPHGQQHVPDRQEHGLFRPAPRRGRVRLGRGAAAAAGILCQRVSLEIRGAGAGQAGKTAVRPADGPDRARPSGRDRGRVRRPARARAGQPRGPDRGPMPAPPPR